MLEEPLRRRLYLLYRLLRQRLIHAHIQLLKLLLLLLLLQNCRLVVLAQAILRVLD